MGERAQGVVFLSQTLRKTINEAVLMHSFFNELASLPMFFPRIFTTEKSILLILQQNPCPRCLETCSDAFSHSVPISRCLLPSD